MILSDDEVLHAWDDDPTWFQPKFKTSHLEANARIKELEAENRCLEMRLEDCRLEAEGVAVYIHEAKRAEDRADRAEAKLRELVKAAEEKDRIENLKEPGHFPNPENRYAFQDTKFRAWDRYQAALKAAKEEMR